MYGANTQQTYKTHRATCLSFCHAMGYAPVPATNDTISRYAAFLASSLKFTSVKQCMNIIRLMHVEWGLGNPLQNNFIVSSLLKGIRRLLGDIVILAIVL